MMQPFEKKALKDAIAALKECAAKLEKCEVSVTTDYNIGVARHAVENQQRDLEQLSAAEESK